MCARVSHVALHMSVWGRQVQARTLYIIYVHT